MQAKSVKTGSKVMLFMGIYALAVSIFWIFMTEVMFMSDFAAFTGQTWSDFLVTNPLQAELYIITKKLVGVEIFLISILIIIITQKSYSQAERWSWYALLIAGTILWGSLIGYRVVIGYLAPSIVTFLFGAVLFIVGITLPAKEILGKKST